jgi:hypothetical protein
MPLQRKKNLETILRELLERLTVARRQVDVIIAAGAALDALDGIEDGPE